MKIRMLFLILVLLLPACKPSSREEPTPDPNAVYTSAAQTVIVQLTQAASKNPSATATQTLTATTAPTNLPENTATNGATTTTEATASQTLPVTADRVEYLRQSLPDGSAVATMEAFSVSWEIKNVGQTTWTTGYTVRFFSGSRIGAGLSNAYSFTRDVLPGETYTVTVDFQTGSELGAYQSNWVLTNQDGNNFYPLFISILVDNPTATPTETETPQPAETETTPDSP